MIITIRIERTARFIPIGHIATTEAPELAERRAAALAWLGSRWLLHPSKRITRSGPYESRLSRLELFARGRKLSRALGWPVDIKPKAIAWSDPREQ